MKKNILLLFLLFTIFSFSQTDIYNYKFVYKIKAQIELGSESIVENMSLYLGKEKSLYISDVKLKVDSARVAIKKRKGSPYELNDFKQSLPKNRIISSLKKQYNTQEIIYTNAVMPSKELYFTTPIPNFEWQIKTDEKKILGYTCQKAILNYKGRNYIAWFSNDLPLQNGPWKFGGLPGLIFEITDSKNHYSFKLIGIKAENKPFPKTGENALKTTEEKYELAVENIFKNLENRLIGESKLRFKRQRIETKKNMKPNPIEIEK